MIKLPKLSPKTTLWSLRINLVFQILIIVTGGAVRLTSSGLGCSTWPMCEPGSFTPEFHTANTIHPYIEFGNRTLTGFLLIGALVVFYATWSDKTRTSKYRFWGLVPLLGVILQAVIGGITVLLDLHPWIVGSHLLISMFLVFASTYLIHLYRRNLATPASLPKAVSSLRIAIMTLLIPVLLLGVITTGAGPHSGDDEVGYRFDVDPIIAAKAHAGATWLFVAAVVALFLLTFKYSNQLVPKSLKKRTEILLVMTLLQGVIGYVQYFNGLPELLVGLHMFGAALLTWATTRLFFYFDEVSEAI